MKKLVRYAVIMAMVLVLAGAGVVGAETLKIGSLSPLTGPYAADGNDIKQGVLTAIDVIMAEGGIPGFDKIELSPQDSACDPRQAVAAANKLLNEEVTAVIGAYCSSATIPSSEPLNEAGIIMITPASTNPQVTERGMKYMFRTCGRDDHQGPSGVKFMATHLKAKKLFIVDDKTTYSQGLADMVAQSAKENGIEVVAHEHVNQGDKDFSAVVTKVKSLNPDVFYISLQNSATGALMVIQAKRAGVEAVLMGQDAVYHPQLVEVAKEAVEGMFLTYGFVDKTTPGYQKFLKAYQAKYGEPGAYSSYAYDSAMAYFMAVKEAGGTDKDKVRDALINKVAFDGASKHVDYTEQGDSGSDYIVWTVKDGKFVQFFNPQTGSLY